MRLRTVFLLVLSFSGCAEQRTHHGGGRIEVESSTTSGDENPEELGFEDPDMADGY